MANRLLTDGAMPEVSPNTGPAVLRRAAESASICPRLTCSSRPSASARGASHRHLVLLCDFDGTLSEFDNDPNAVWLKPSRRDLLERLAHGPGQTIAIVSGRRLDDVKQRTALAGDVYHAGLHGLEIESSREHYLHPGLPRAEAALRALCRAARRGARNHRRRLPRGQDARARRPFQGLDCQKGRNRPRTCSCATPSGISTPARCGSCAVPA